MKRLLVSFVVLAWLLLIGGLVGRSSVEAWFNSRDFDLKEWNQAKKEADLREMRYYIQRDLGILHLCSSVKVGPDRAKCMKEILSKSWKESTFEKRQ